MIDPKTVLLALPCGNGQNMAELTGSLIRVSNRFGAVSIHSDCSLIAPVRNTIAEILLASPMEWLFSVDSDIAFSVQDFNFLMEPCAPNARGGPDPTKVSGIQLLTSEPNPDFGIQGTPHAQDRYLKVPGEADAIVVCEYRQKTDDEIKNVNLGMGFVRIHRSVFEALIDLKHSMDDFVRLSKSEFDEACEQSHDGILTFHKSDFRHEGGGPRVAQLMHNGKMLYDFYPQGAMISALVPEVSYKGEDHGFFTLCMLAGIIPRIETRTRLIHIGRKAFPYMGSDPDHANYAE
jgi:hypothetical protein